jgi:two-component system, NtrC family, sensor kinase
MSEATPLQPKRVDAIGDLLQTLGRAPFDLDAVLATIPHQAVGLCRADRGFIYLLENGSYHHAAAVGATPEMVAFNREHPIRPTRGTLTGRTVIERRPVHIPDVLDDPAYDYAEAQRLGGFRAMLGVPMLRNDVVVGVLDLWRDLPRPFSGAEIELVTQFSDAAAIAIELTRLTKTIDRQRSELTRYVSPQVAGLVTSDEGERVLAGHRR